MAWKIPGAGRDGRGSQRGQSCRREHGGGLGRRLGDLHCEGGERGQEIVSSALGLTYWSLASYVTSVSLRLYIAKMGHSRWCQRVACISCPSA